MYFYYVNVYLFVANMTERSFYISTYTYNNNSFFLFVKCIYACIMLHARLGGTGVPLPRGSEKSFSHTINRHGQSANGTVHKGDGITSPVCFNLNLYTTGNNTVSLYPNQHIIIVHNSVVISNE